MSYRAYISGETDLARLLQFLPQFAASGGSVDVRFSVEPSHTSLAVRVDIHVYRLADGALPLLASLNAGDLSVLVEAEQSNTRVDLAAVPPPAAPTPPRRMISRGKQLGEQ